MAGVPILYVLVTWGRRKTSADICRTRLIRQFGTNLERTTESTAQRCRELDTAIIERLRDRKYIIVDRAKAYPRDWRLYDLDADQEFIDEFHHTVSDKAILEADQ